MEGAVQGVVTVIDDVAGEVGDIGRAIGVGMRLQVADVLTDAGGRVLESRRVAPEGLPAVRLGAILRPLRAVDVVVDPLAVAQIDRLEDVLEAVLIHTGLDDLEQVVAGTVFLHQRIGVVADREGIILVREVVAIGLVTAAVITKARANVLRSGKDSVMIWQGQPDLRASDEANESRSECLERYSSKGCT